EWGCEVLGYWGRGARFPASPPIPRAPNTPHNPHLVIPSSSAPALSPPRWRRSMAPGGLVCPYVPIMSETTCGWKLGSNSNRQGVEHAGKREIYQRNESSDGPRT